MAKASKKVVGVPASRILEDDTRGVKAPVVNVDQVAEAAIACGRSAADATKALFDLLKASAKTRFDDIQKNFTIGHMARAMNASVTIAANEYDKLPFNSLPTAKNTDKNRTREWNLAWGSAKTAFSRHMDKARDMKIEGIPAKKTAAPRVPKSDTPDATTPATPVADAPVAIGSISLPRTSTPKAFIHEAAQLISALRRLQKINKDQCKGDDASALIIWLSEAPNFAD